MLSLPKIIAFAGLIAAVWYGFKLIDRLDKARRQKDAAPAERREARPPKKEDGVVDLVEGEDGSYSVKDEDRRR